MTRKLSVATAAVVLGCLTGLICTKIPGDMGTLRRNIGATSLLSPTDASIENILAPKLIWESVPGATRYSVQVSTAGDFSAIVFEDTAVIDTYKVATGLNYTTIYYWRVQVHDSTSSSGWTTRNVFTTIGAPAVPVLSGPTDAMTSAPTALILSWTVAGNALSYWLQVASDSGFVNLVEVDSMLADTSKLVSNLSNSTTYFWRVRSQNPGGVSAWTSIRRFTTIVAAPKAPTTVSPANGATGQPLSLSLVWNKVPQASWYSLQLATDVACATIIFTDSTITDTSRAVHGLANGVLYYWRVKAKNLGGVSAWSGLSGFTTVSALPGQPVLVSPANGAAGQPIPLTLSWNKATGAAQYYLQIAPDSAFSALTLVDSALADTFKTTSALLNNTRYYWRVRAKNPTGASAWTGAWSFTTFAAALGTPVLLTPSVGAVNQPLTTVLAWDAVSGANQYQVEVSTNSNFSQVIIQDTSVTDTSRKLTGLANNTTYYWHVRAKGAAGLSNWTIPWSFTTIMAAPQTPHLLVPSNGATDQQLSLTLIWDAAAGAATYAVQVASDSNFAVVVTQDSLLTDTIKTVGGLSNGTTYYWHVKSKNAVGSSSWSAVRSFTTFAATLQTPTLTVPRNGATGQPVAPTLAWSTVANATAYEVQVAEASDFSTVLTDNPMVTADTIVLTGLANSAVYYWRVRAKNLSGAGNWTDPWSFTTVITTPAVPVPVLPADKASNQPVALTLTWNEAIGATAYYSAVATDTGFVNIVKTDSVLTLTDTTCAIGGLANGTTYYWHVQAKNAGGLSAWSGRRSFTTVVLPPSAPKLLYPVDVSGLGLNVALRWAADTSAVTYRIQVSTTSDFLSGLLVDDSNWTNSERSVGTLSDGTRLSYGTQYFWRVNAKNDGGTSAWTAAAFWTVKKFALSVSVTNGSVDVNPTGPYYDSGTVVKLTAAPATGYQFSNWSGDVSGSTNPVSIVMVGPQNITANFVLIPYSLTIYSGTGGTITLPSAGVITVRYGVATTITAVPDNGFNFANWTIINGTATIADANAASTTVTLTSGNAALTANFAPKQFILTTVAGTGGSITLPSTSPVTVNYGVATTIKAVPSTGFNFTGWTVTNGTATIADANAASTIVTLTSGNATVTASFTISPTFTVTDTDGNIYHTIMIGTQVWMVENLKTTRYNDGTPIPLVADSMAWVNLITPGYCWYNDSISNGSTYGGLYNWYALNTGKLAPKGWHVPTDSEWTVLTTYIGGTSMAGGKLKETGTAHWNSPNTGATNNYGFTALPGGLRDDGSSGVHIGAFLYIGTVGYWWSTTAFDASSTFFRYIFNNDAAVYCNAAMGNRAGLSVRCIRDRD